MVELFTKIGRLKRQLEWLPVFIVRLLAGLFLILSGFFKLIDKDQHSLILKGLTNAHLEWAHFYSYFLPIVMILCGALLIVGFLTTLSSLILFIIAMTSLVVINRVDSLIKYQGSTLMENLFYLPEALYALIFLWLFFAGPGKISLDYKYGKKRRKMHLTSSSPFTRQREVSH
ncbi:MAG: DoxX family protein [Chlamydiota bacterium]